MAQISFKANEPDEAEILIVVNQIMRREADLYVAIESLPHICRCFDEDTPSEKIRQVRGLLQETLNER